MTHSRLPNFHRLVSCGTEEAGMNGWRERAAGMRNVCRAAFAVVRFFDIIRSMKTAKEKSSTKTCSAKAPASKGGVPSVSESGEVVKFNETGMPQIDVWLEDETIWLTQKQMGLLFGVVEHTITYHIQEITKSGELEGLATTR